MNKFPSEGPEHRPDQVQFAKEVYEHLGCKDILTRKFIETCLVAIRVFDQKQQSYGPGNIAAAGAPGVMIRSNDKIQRLLNLVGKATEPADETLEDTFGDLGVYGLIGLMCRWGWWPGVAKGGVPVAPPAQAPAEDPDAFFTRMRKDGQGFTHTQEQEIRKALAGAR